MKFITDQNNLIIKFEGLEIFFAFRLKLTLPKNYIRSVKWQPSFTFEHRVWKIVGSGIPGMLAAGDFKGAGTNYFLYLKGTKVMRWTGSPLSASNVLVIELDNYKYNQVLLSTSEADSAPVVGWSKQ